MCAPRERSKGCLPIGGRSIGKLSFTAAAPRDQEGQLAALFAPPGSPPPPVEAVQGDGGDADADADVDVDADDDNVVVDRNDSRREKQHAERSGSFRLVEDCPASGRWSLDPLTHCVSREDLPRKVWLAKECQ